MGKAVVMPLVAAIVLSLTSVAWTAEGVPSKKANPHTGKVNCSLCHVATDDDLASPDKPSAVKKRLHGDLNQPCLQCHGASFGHGVGKRPEMNKLGLPLDSAGKITCAVTCHDFHEQAAASPELSRYHLRLPVQTLCTSCHEK